MRGTWSVLPNRCPYVNTSVVKPLILCSFSRRHAEYANGEGVIFDVIIRVAHAFRGDNLLADSVWRQCFFEEGTVYLSHRKNVFFLDVNCKLQLQENVEENFRLSPHVKLKLLVAIRPIKQQCLKTYLVYIVPKLYTFYFENIGTCHAGPQL